VQKVLEQKYKLKCTIQSAGKEGQYVIYFWKQTMPVLSRTVKPYMVTSMHYKLNGF
jgi:ubiquinol-cytochrome c reductase cytochrome b subunit